VVQQVITGKFLECLFYDSNNGDNSMMIYIAELSTPFLNVSWLLNELDIFPTLFLVITILLGASFFVSRVIMGPYLFFHMIYHWTIKENDNLSLFVYQINIGIVLFFILMNYYWFYLLANKALSVSKKAKKSSKSQ
jgi:hypothetical protein